MGKGNFKISFKVLINNGSKLFLRRYSPISFKNSSFLTPPIVHCQSADYFIIFQAIKLTHKTKPSYFA